MRGLVVLALAIPLAAQTDEGGAIFRKHIAPMIQTKCVSCHGERQRISGFSIGSRAALLKGGNRGAALIPGYAKDSLLLAVLDHSHIVKMPPGATLPVETIAAVRRWIDLGAPWANDVPSAVETSANDDRWAFQPIKSFAPPAKTANPIDAFLNVKLAEKNLRPSPATDRYTLIRRATFDLWGLPPTTAEVAAFVNDQSPQAWNKLIDRLLASPRYGERWGRHWLDIVRYADSSGFSNDFERPNAWRYRDYVIRAFNTGKPFRDLIVEQIAGDELDAKDPEKLVATGFLRMGPWEQTAMSVAAITRQEWLDDVTHTTAATFLGVTLECARCHDHKFDPIPTKDYYSIQAAFATTEFAERAAPFQASEIRASFAEDRKQLQQLVASNKTSIGEYDAIVRQRFVEQNPQASANEIAAAVRTKKLLTPEEFENFKVFQKIEQLNAKSIERYSPLAFSVTSITKDPPDTFILPVGNLMTPGAKVTPAILQSANWSDNASLPLAIEGRRLALARWIADPRNPLTYRTIVNRIWHSHFGQGIAATPNDLGKMGKRPSHPELLDYLSTVFIDHNTSFKTMHRLIMTSEAYQRSSMSPDPDALAKLDPEHLLFSTFPPRRHEAEVIRDSILFAAGELSLDTEADTGGPGTYPEINSDIANQPVQIMGTLMPAYRPSPTPRLRHRRTIYTYQKRNLADPLIEVFNGPSLAESTAKRDATTIPTQAYALMNGKFVNDMSLALAAKSAITSDPLADLYSRAFQRPPTAKERTMLSTHLVKRIAYHSAHPATAPPSQPPLMRSITSELTGDSVMVREQDPAVAIQPNLQPHEVTPQVRALADLALVLLNSNEFLYRY